MMRSSERPATQSLRPTALATSPKVCRRAALEAKVVTSTLPFAPLIVLISPSRTSPSEPLASGLKTRSEEHTSELQSLMRISYAVFCLKKKNKIKRNKTSQHDGQTT